MVSQTLDVVDSLLLDVVEHWLLSGVHCASEHHIMPDKHALLIACVVEDIVFVLSSTPQAKHVVVGVYSCLYSQVVDQPVVLKRPRHEHIWWDVVGAPHENRHSVQLEIERSPKTIGV